MSLTPLIKSKWTQAQNNVSEFHSRYDTVYEIQQAEHAKTLEEANSHLDKVQQSITQFNNDPVVTKALKEADAHVKELEKLEKEKTELEEALKKVEQDQDIKDKLHDIEEQQKKLEGFDKNVDKANKWIDKINKEISKVNKKLDEGATAFDNVSSELSQNVEQSKISKTVADISKKYDETLSKAAKAITGDESTKFVEAWAREKYGDKLYDATSAIKNGASDVISGIDGFRSLGKTFGGSWRDPQVAAKKIETGLKTIQTAVGQITEVTNKVFVAVKGKDSVVLGKLGTFNSVGISSMGDLAGAVSSGIGSITSFRNGNISGGIDGIKSTVTSIKGAVDTIWQHKIDFQKKELEAEKLERANQLIKSKKGDPGTAAGGAAGIDYAYTNSLLRGDGVTSSSSKETMDAMSRDGFDTTQTNIESSVLGAGGDDDYGADMINEVHVLLEGGNPSDISCCTINGVKYKCSGYTLSQELLQPMILSFSIEKENKEETQQDVIFADATQIIGKTLELNATTIKTSQDKGSPRKAFTFKGMIIDVSASRATASAQSATVTAATWDSLLQNAPHCRSFEKMTLKDIVSKVLEPYSEIESNINPRYEKVIPYIVQYNQSDFSFVRMLAARFGEWMYNTGEKFVFGNMEDAGGTADLEYPGGSLMSYHLNQEMAAFSFSHLLPDHYKYGSSGAILKKPGINVADGNVNDWTDKAYQASQLRYAQEHITALANGGFDDWESEEGAESIMDYSLKIEANGMKTALMTVGGGSKLAMLKIGQPFMICDNVQNKSGENLDVQQKILKIVGIHHSFDYRQEYSNSFTAIPIGCQYPSYSDSTLHAVAPTQRAKVVENKDEKKLGRIRVQFPWQEEQDPKMKTPWLRIAVPYAGKEKGHLFVPEIGEEVIVGFEMDNAERPYIIGALYNGGDGKPDEKWASINSENGTTNNIKAIRTRNGHTILINDRGDAGLLEIYDNKNNTYHITLSADDKKITIYSAGDIEINADGSITMNAKENVSVNANKEVSIQASKVKVR